MRLGRKRERSPGDSIADALEEFELPTFPQFASEALQQLSDPGVDMRIVAATLQRDPGLSVHFLRLANSASLGLRSSVDSLDRAMVMLGRNQVESMLISQAVVGSLSSSSKVIDPQRFWATAAMRAALAARVASVMDPPRKSEHFTAGLLQDMALLVMADHIDGYEDLLADWYEGRVVDLMEAETDRFGVDHAEIGATMCRSWNFPENLTAAVASHHAVDEPQTPAQLVGAFHEVDLEQGPRSFGERAAAIAQIADQAEALIEAAAEDAGDIARTVSP